MRSRKRQKGTRAEEILDPKETSVLDALDSLLNKGVVVTGDVVLGVAGVDLVYLRLSTLLTAVDRLTSNGRPRRLRRSRGPSLLRRPE